MNTFAQAFVFILMLWIGDATQGPTLGSLARHSGKERLMRKEAVQIDAASFVRHIHSVGLKEQSSQQSALKGKIEQGGKCLAATRSTTNASHGDHKIEMVLCNSSTSTYEMEWEADAVDTAGQIELDDGHEHKLCLEADLDDDEIHLKLCADHDHESHDHQLFTYNNVTNEIKIGTQCVTVHDHDSDGELTLENCTDPVESDQEFVFEESHHSLPASTGVMHHGKIEHKNSSKCIAAHKTSTDAEDLEAVSCGGDDDDDEEWEADASIEHSHSSHAPQQIKLQSTAHGSLCLTADSAFDEVELRHCHTHTHHHRQLWIYENDEFKMTDPHTGDVKCLATEPEEDDVAAEPEDNLILEDCTGNDDQEWEWESD